MTKQEQKDKLFLGLYIFDSLFVSEYFDEEDMYTFDCRLDVNAAYDNVRSWLGYAVVKNTDYVFSFGKYQGLPLTQVLAKDTQYIEYCLREVDRFYLDKEVVSNMIDDNWVFSNATIKIYRQKLNDLEAARYIESKWKTLDARLEQQRQNEFDQMEDNWLNSQW